MTSIGSSSIGSAIPGLTDGLHLPRAADRHRRDSASSEPSVDVSEMIEALSVSLQFEQFIHRLMLNLALAPHQFHTTIDNSLGHAATLLHVDRISIHRFNEDTLAFERTQEWRSQMVPATATVIHGQQFPRILDHLRCGSTIRPIGHTRTTIIPLHANDRLFGTLTVTSASEHPRTGHSQHNHQLVHLRLLGVVLTYALEQQRLREESQRHLQEAAHIARVVAVAGLTTSIAHEINQPLTAILSNAQAGQRLLMDSNPPIDSIRSIFEDIVAGVVRTGNLVRQMHGLFKKRTSEPMPCRLNEVVQSVVRLTESDTIIHQVQVHLHLDATDPIVFGDRIQLQQITLNLVKNAIEALYLSETPTRFIRITTGLADNGRVQLTVTDSGPGIAPQDMRGIFDSFYTTKAHGLGVGLSISRSLVLAHHGTLSVVNNTEGGASFQVSLPLIRNEHQ